MGWMWSSPPPKGPNSNPSPSSESSKPSPPTKQAESEYSDPEIAKFMAQLQEEFGSSSKPAEAAKPQPPPSPRSSSSSAAPPPQPATSSSSSSSSSSWTRALWGSSNKTAASAPSSPSDTKPLRQQTWTPTRLDPLSESQLPSTMSCRQAFDAAFYCNSVGGQWTAVYREGNVRSCSEHWDDFWFCMRARALSTPQKEAAIRDRYRRKEYAKYFAPDRASSADVWEPRDEMLEPGAAFAEPLEMPDVSDEEWRRQEIDRRRRVREMLEKDQA